MHIVHSKYEWQITPNGADLHDHPLPVYSRVRLYCELIELVFGTPLAPSVIKGFGLG